MNDSTKYFIELYRRRKFDRIPVYFDETGIYYLSPPQLKTLEYLFDNTTMYVGYGGSGMSGKSQLLCFWLIFNCLAFDDTRWMLGRKELANLKLTTFQTLLRTLTFYGLEKDVDYVYNAQSNILQFANTSQIILKDTKYIPSDPEMTDLGGLEITGAALDESAENVIKVINILTSRVGRWNNKKHGLHQAKILEGFNPMKNHVSDRYWKPYKEDKETIDTKFVRALCTDNPHPEAKQWAENILKTGDKRTIQRLYYGNFEYDDDDNALCTYDKICDQFTNSFVDLDNENAKNYLTIDVAITNDRFVCYAWQGLRVKEIYYTKNAAKPVSVQNENGEWINKVDFTPIINEIERLAVKWKVPRSNIAYDADGIGAKLKMYLQGCIAIHNGRAPIHPEYKNLSTELGYKLAEIINADGIYYDCYVEPEIKDIIKTELQASLKRDSKIGEKLSLPPKDDVKKLIGHSPDFFDACKYRMLFLITRKN